MASESGHRGRALARHGEEEERRLEEGAGKRAAGWARMGTAAARQRARSSDGGACSCACSQLSPSSTSCLTKYIAKSGFRRTCQQATSA